MHKPATGPERPAPAPLAGLSDRLLEQVLLPLDLDQRCRCMLICRRFAEVGRRATLLWKTAEFAPDGQDVRKVLEWLVIHHSQIRHLSLRPSEEQQRPSLLALWGMMTSGFVACASTLISLDFSLPSELELSGWVTPLAHLRWLSASARRITVTSDIGHLCNLETLQLGTQHAEDATESNIVFAEHSIPPGLRALVLDDLFLTELPSALSAAAGSLTRLSMDANYSDRFVEEGVAPGSVWGLGPLASLSRLEVLELQHSDTATIPPEISHLTSLTYLCLSWSFTTNSPTDMHALAELRALRVVDCQFCNLRALDAALHGLTALRTLCLSGNPELELPADTAWLPRLTQLDLDLEAAVNVVNCDLIAGMVGLEYLCLSGFDQQPLKPLSTAGIVRLIHALKGLPRLRFLLFKNSGQQLMTQSVETLAAFTDLLRQRPALELRGAPRDVGNPFNGCWPTWRQVEEPGGEGEQAAPAAQGGAG